VTSARWRAGPVCVRVPATSANLGPGFDALGLALDLHDEVTARVTPTGLRIDVDGEDADGVPRDETHLVVQAARAAFDRLGAQPSGLAIDCVNRIPHGRGLGSSSAAIVAGVLLARALIVGGLERLPDPDVLRLTAELEGHPDNVAPCLLGGLCVAWTADHGARAERLTVRLPVRPVVLVPPTTSSTHVSRGLLPGCVPHADAAVTASRAALLVAALTGGLDAADVLIVATEDRLHQPYRAASMPDSAALLNALRSSGTAAVHSGAGPTVLALARDVEEVERTLAATPTGWRGLALDIDQQGAFLVSG
jgi:homoserine kinase